VTVPPKSAHDDRLPVLAVEQDIRRPFTLEPSFFGIARELSAGESSSDSDGS
jgi:hypothetical protein